MTARKNNRIDPANHWRSEALFAGLLLMLAAVFVSRAALSISLLLFVSVALLHKNILAQAKTFFSTPYLLFFSLLFFIPFLSGLWSSNLSKWSDVVRIKLPLLFLPLAFAGAWQLAKRQWLALSLLFLLAVFGSCVWSLLHYAQNPEAVHEGYLRAKTILTPLENDHVRFSWLVAVAVIVALLLVELSTQRLHKGLLTFLAAFFALYLHVLSARTGLLTLYLFLLLYGFWQLRNRSNGKAATLVFAFCLALPLAAYFLLPTFRARLRYNVYDWEFVKKQEYLPGSNDGARTMSLKAGWQVLRQNPLGVGAGDVMQEADKWYASNVPQVLPADKFYPSSEWLLYGAFAGWPGVALFTAVMVFPFFIQLQRFRIYWIGFHASAALSFLFDMGLEVQYGVFLYAFVAMTLWKWSSQQTMHN